MKAITICFVLIISFVGTVNAQIYKWVDEKGITHYSNKRPPTMKDVETKSEIRNEQPNDRSTKEFDKLLNSYRNGSLPKPASNQQKTKFKSQNIPDQDRLQYFENRIKQREKIVHRYKDDLRDVKRTPHKDYRSHKKRLRYYEDRLEHAQMDLEEAQNNYQEYINDQ